MAKVDDLGIELDEETEKLLADPKAGNIQKAVNYFMTRREKEREKAREEEAKKNKTEGMFGGMFE